jgi:hypothetical protein
MRMVRRPSFAKDAAFADIATTGGLTKGGKSTKNQGLHLLALPKNFQEASRDIS